MKYQLLDSGNNRKLEQVGPYRLVRPALNAFWAPSLKNSEWENVQGIFERNSSGGGKWQWLNGGTPQSWEVEWAGMTLLVKPTNFGHLGFFAEQYANWDWQKSVIKKMSFQPNILNLFAYSGVGSMAMASAGAEVCHLDAAKGMIDWGRENMTLNPDIPDKIRWIADDVVKFTNREIRRGNKYNGIVMDPPSFGRGPKGQVWKMEESILPLLETCSQLIDKSKPFFMLLSCHSPGFSPIVLERLLSSIVSGNGKVSSGEMTIPEASDRLLPAGIYARLEVGF